MLVIASLQINEKDRQRKAENIFVIPQKGGRREVEMNDTHGYGTCIPVTGTRGANLFEGRKVAINVCSRKEEREREIC